MSRYFATEEYYCKICKHAHHYLSKKGKEHIKHASTAAKKKAFLDYGVY